MVCFVFIFILSAAAFGSLPPEPAPPLENNHSPSAEEILLRNMPDPNIDPEGYRIWKANLASSHAGRDAFSRPTAPMILEQDNGYVHFRMDQPNGSFVEGCRPTGGGAWMRLTYRYPTPPWDFTIYKIDTNTPEKSNNRPGTGCNALPAPDSTYNIGTKTYAVWNNRFGVKIVQILECVRLGAAPGDLEQVKRTNLMIPRDGSCHDVGCLDYYDTM